MDVTHKSGPVSTGWKCPYCELQFHTLKGVRMHQGYKHKRQIRSAVAIIVEQKPGIRTADIAHIINEREGTTLKYLKSNNKVRRGPLHNHGGTSWYPKDWPEDEKVVTLSTRNTVVCPKCGKGFTSNRSLSSHKRWHTMREDKQRKHNPVPPINTGPIPPLTQELVVVDAPLTTYTYTKVSRWKCFKGVFTGKVQM